jgi:oligopeptide/dipeptide ABC transporter ATP-binding protein
VQEPPDEVLVAPDLPAAGHLGLDPLTPDGRVKEAVPAADAAMAPGAAAPSTRGARPSTAAADDSQTSAAAATPILEVRGLAVEFQARGGSVRVVDDVSFAIAPGEIVGLVGESGSGKSVTMLSVLRLVPPPGRVVAGRITFKGRDMLSLDRDQMRSLRGSEIALIPPDATAALNPVVRAGDQVVEGLLSHGRTSGKPEARRLALEMFARIGLANPELRYRRYPHELSGGMQQRMLVASALLLSPGLILADEPTTALDVTIQAQILRLLLEVRNEFGTAIFFVTHDLAAVAEICDRVLVMYAGHIVEAAPVQELFSRPLHPYTRALMSSVPPLSATPTDSLTAIAGAPPDPGAWPPGCRFAARCALRVKLGSPEACVTVDPPLAPVGPDHASACHFAFRTPEMDTISANIDAEVTAAAEAAEEGILDNVGAAALDPLLGSPGAQPEDRNL